MVNKQAQRLKGFVACAWAISFVLATQLTLNPFYSRPNAGTASNFFYAQMQAMLTGSFDVLPSDLPGECYIVESSCLGYYGLAPSFLRLPLLFFGLADLAPVFTATAFATISWAAGKILFEQFPLNASRLALLTSLTLGGLLIELTRIAVYEEAILWAIAFSLLSFLKWKAWLQSRAWQDFAWTIAFLFMACNSRPSSFGMAVGLGLGTAVIVGSMKRSLFFVLPILTSLYFNYEKFGSVVPNLSLHEQVPETQHWEQIYSANGGLDMSILFIPTNLSNYLRLDGITVEKSFPFVDYNLPSQARGTLWLLIDEGSLYIERMASLPIMAFAPICVALFGFCRHDNPVGVEFTKPLRRDPIFFLILGSIFMTLPALTNVAVTNRYMGDFFPLLLGFCALLTYLKPTQTKSARLRTFVILVTMSFSAYIHLVLAVRFSWWI